MKTTIHYETLDRLSDVAKISPMINTLTREIEQTENTFDLVRLLTTYVISLEDSTRIRREEVAAYLAKKAFPDPLTMSEERFKKEFMGDFTKAEQGN